MIEVQKKVEGRAFRASGNRQWYRRSATYLEPLQIQAGFVCGTSYVPSLALPTCHVDGPLSISNVYQFWRECLKGNERLFDGLIECSATCLHHSVQRVQSPQTDSMLCRCTHSTFCGYEVGVVQCTFWDACYTTNFYTQNILWVQSWCCAVHFLGRMLHNKLLHTAHSGGTKLVLRSPLSGLDAT
jgi:hypothetical protein